MSISLWGAGWSYASSAVIGPGVVIQFFGALVALAIALFGFKAYRLTEDKKYLYFSGAFGLLSIELFFYAATLLARFVYYENFKHIDPGFLLNISQGVKFVLMFAILMAYAIFVIIYGRMGSRSVMALVGALVLALVVYSYRFQSLTGFNLSAALLLLFIVYYTTINFYKTQKKNAFLVLLAFVLLLVGHLLFIVERFDSVFFLLGNISQLVGYLSLLLMVVRINKYGRKKR